MEADIIIEKQKRFFIEKKAGCLFAAVAARNPQKYGWIHAVLTPTSKSIDHAIDEAIETPTTTMVSLLFPEVKTVNQLLDFVSVLKRCRTLNLAQVETFDESVCLGFRARIGSNASFVTGFGDYPFLPATRRAPTVEITTRVKPRPSYTFTFKSAPDNVIHLADLDMKGMAFERMQKLWDNSFVQTKRILGMKPNLKSAARTTFSIPMELFSQIS
ncbi:MAG: hypothetical protein ABL986_22525 [Vicinamibacterales bacterium]